MKVGILTIYDLMNYGNRLQNYATIYCLNKLGIDGETIILHCYHMKKLLKDFIFKIIQKPICLDWNIKQESKKYVGKLSELERKKYESFKTFSYKYTKIKHRYYISPFSYFLDKKYDTFFVGSDQVWNPYAAQANKWEFLNFASKGKRNSWAASFGVSDIDEKFSNIFSLLNKMDNISVREESGAEIVKKYTKKRPTVLIDPTMMLNKSEWLKIAEKPAGIESNNPYILTYFLGSYTERIKADLHCIAKKNNLNIYNLNDISQSDLYISGPSEFIYLISKASLILTDSFHACVFSFLFEKPFLVYAREGKENNMISRIETLLKTFHLERKYVDSGLENNLFEADYKDGYKQLAFEREKALNFLKKSMNIE